MSEKSSIEWTDATWNPTTGCTKVSPGCANCYIERTVPFRTKGLQFVNGHIPLTLHEGRLEQPLRWRKPKRVFVNSLSDLFHPDVPDEFIDRVFAVMALTPQHTYQVLTKRPERMCAYISSRAEPILGGPTADVYQSVYYVTEDNNAGQRVASGAWPLPNVWLGVSVENQHFADERIPLLLETPAAVRFISAEPLLGPLDFTLRGDRIPNWDEDWRYNVLSGEEWAGPRDDDPERSQHLDWVIIGGESGPGARLFDLEWARTIVEQCHAAGVACFVKQLGANAVYTDDFPDGSQPCCRIDLRNRKGGDPSEWPEFFRVRQFPEAGKDLIDAL